jgi:TolB protein
MNADGTGRRVLSRDAQQAGLAWSPDGRKIAFVGSPPGLAAELYVMNVDGSGRRRLTHSHRSDEVAWPSWSSDGRMIAFIRNEGVHRLDSLYVVNVDGSGERRVTRLVVRPARSTYRAFSPDGKQIAFAKFVSATSGQVEAFIVNADGSGLRNLTREWGVDGIPVWSPDGRRIAFVSWPDGELSVMNADGTGRQTLSRAAFGIPIWSPDGREIAFEAVRTPQGGQLPEIHVVNADGTRERTLTTHGAEPVWSPDGRKIVFVKTVVERAGSRSQGPPFDLQIYVVNADGSGQRRLTHSVFEDAMAAWSPLERQT